MAPVTINLEPHYKGDSWHGVEIGPVLINDAVPSAALVNCRMQFRDKRDALGYELNSTVAVGKGLITILDPNTWEMQVNGQVLDIPEGRWKWDFETTDANGVVRTLYKGVLQVNGDVSHG